MGEYFYKMIRSMRVNKNYTQRQLASGLCSVSMLSYIEKGERIPSREIKQRMYERMGGSFLGFVNILNGDESKICRIKTDIIELIEEDKWENLDEQLSILKSLINEKDSVSKQFLYDIQGIQAIRKEDYCEAKELYKKAIKCTINTQNLNNSRQYILAAIEYYYILMYYYCLSKTNDADSTYINEQIKDLINQIETSNLEEINKAAVFGYVLTRYYEFVKNTNFNEQLYLKNKIDTALSMVTKCGYIFNVYDLLNNKIEICELLHDFEDEKVIARKKLNAIDKLYNVASVRHNAFYSILFLYNESFIDISYMIKARRKMLKLTQDQLVEGICSVKTLRRIEQGIVNTQYAVLNPICKRLGLSGEFQYYNYITENWEIINTAYEYRIAARDRDFLKARYLLDRIETKVDKSPQNKQIIIMDKAYIDFNYGKISQKEYLEKLKEALKLTIDINQEMDYSVSFFTEKEMECLFRMANIESAENSEKIKNMIFPQLEYDRCKHLNKEFLALLSRWLSSEHAKKGNYSISDKYALLAIQTDLKNHRIRTAYKSYYDIIWNSVISGNEKEPYNSDIYHDISQCYTLADFMDDRVATDFFRKTLNFIKEKDNSWLC